jgi:cytochrome c556
LYDPVRLNNESALMKHLRAAAVVLSVCLAIPAWAQFRKPEEAIKYRQSVMFTMGNHLYLRLGPMVNGRVPFDAKAAVDNADLVATLSRLPWIAFQPGTDKGDTDAKPAVWTEQAKFKDLGEKMQLEVTKLSAAARTGDLEALKAAYRATTNSCKACHDSFTSQ